MRFWNSVLFQVTEKSKSPKTRSTPNWLDSEDSFCRAGLPPRQPELKPSKSEKGSAMLVSPQVTGFSSCSRLGAMKASPFSYSNSLC